MLARAQRFPISRLLSVLYLKILSDFFPKLHEGPLLPGLRESNNGGQCFFPGAVYKDPVLGLRDFKNGRWCVFYGSIFLTCERFIPQDDYQYVSVSAIRFPYGAYGGRCFFLALRLSFIRILY